MGKKSKQPKIAPGLPSDPGKVPRVSAEPQSYDRMNPAWRVRSMEFCDPYGWHAVSEDILTTIRVKLANFESMTWAEILRGAKKQNHAVEIHKLSKSAKDRLAALKQDDVDSLISLRLGGTERVWGIRELNVLRLLWWDPNHQVCPSILKHT